MVVDESFKLPLFDGNGQFVNGNEEVGRNEVAIEDVMKDILVEGFGKE